MWPSKACRVQVSSESSWIQAGCLQVNLDEAMQLRRKEAPFMPDSLLCWETGNNFLKTDENVWLVGQLDRIFFRFRFTLPDLYKSLTVYFHKQGITSKIRKKTASLLLFNLMIRTYPRHSHSPIVEKNCVCNIDLK